MLERMIASICSINSKLIRHGLAGKMLAIHEKDIKDYCENSNIIIEDSVGYKFDNVYTICDKLRFDFVFVDYIQMISTKGYKSKVDAIEEYVRKLTELGITQNFGVIILSQINRSGEDEPTMSKYKWAGVLEEHPANCIVLNYNKKKGTYKVQIEKQRHGEIKDIQVKFEPQFSSFRELTEDEKSYLDENIGSKPSRKGLYED